MSQSSETKSDPFPSLDKAFARRVQEKLNRYFGKDAPQIAWENWLKLKPHLSAYKREAEDVRGYLKKGDAELLRAISKRAKSMLVALKRADEASLAVPIASVLDPILLDDFQDLLRRIEEDFALKGKIAPDFPDMSRANLFSKFEAWWTRTTGLPAEIAEGWTGNTHPTSFMLVANEVFNMHGMLVPIGASYKSLKDFKRTDRDRFTKHKKFADKLKKLGLLE